MAELKTKPTGADVEQYLNGLADERQRRDSLALLALMRQVTRQEPKLWSGNMIGFGDHHYKYASGHEGDTFLVGFAPRKSNLTLYVLAGFAEQADLLEKLGRHKVGKACLYLKRLDDVHLPTLRQLIQRSFKSKRPDSA